MAVSRGSLPGRPHYSGHEGSRAVGNRPRFAVRRRPRGIFRTSLYQIPARRRPGISRCLPGKRLVCVANMKPQKGHLFLIEAMQEVVRRAPDAHLLLVGDASAGTSGAR